MSILDHQLLRTSHPRHTGPYLHRIVTEKKNNTNAISRELLSAVTNQSLPPQAYELWLCACPDETAIILGLQQPQSVLVRRGAIKAFKRWFRTSKCVAIWNAVGGTKGIVAMLADFSVNHVREFCKVLGQCNTSEALRDERQKLVTELMYCLASRIFPTSAKVQNPDERPLWKSYAELVYACTPNARDAWIDEKRLPELNMEKVMETDTDYYQAQCLRKAAAGDTDLQRYSALFVSLPPRMSAEDPTVSESMEFAAHFLETLEEHGLAPVKRGGEREIGAAFVTLIRRLARRSVSDDFVLETITLLSKCAKQHVLDEASGYNSNYGDYLTDVARLWARNPDAFEGPLSGLLKISDRINYPSLVAAISVVPMKGRYRLLRWIILTQHEIDLEDPDQLPRLRYPVPWALPMELPKFEARALVERVVSVKGENDTWFNGTIPDVRIPTLKNVTVVLDLLRCHLLDDNNNRLREASMKTAQYQRLAEKERDAQSRVNLVIAAGYMAVASGSLDLLKAVLIWARRYNRDPLITQFYAPDTLFRETETVSLLSGISERSISATQQDVVEKNIRKGNEIALLLLETASMCQNEPSFYATHWSTLQHLFADIVQVRIQRAGRVQSRLRLSDEEVKSSIWEPTLDALLDAEKLGLDDSNQALQFSDKNGPLDIWADVDANNPNSSVLWFIDELAARRDALWQHYRCTMHTNVMTLEAPWPRGLPLQDLLSVYIQGKVSGEELPFVSKRAHDVVFMSQEDALRAIPNDKEDRAAIGCFVDDYGFALKIYVSGCNKEEKQKRSNASWEHATTQLSEPRLSSREAIMYWRDVFTAADISFPASTLELRPAPRLPQVEVDDGKSEWNPDLGPHPTIRERKLDPTCLDCCTSGTWNKTIHDAFTVPQPLISLDDVPGFWNFDRPGSGIPSAAKDGFIAAGLLLIDALSQSNAKVLSEAFPRDSARFPAVFLDSDFVESQRSFDAYPLELLNNTPPVLLEQLTTALIAKLCASTKPPPALVKWTFTTLKLLALSDDPGLAISHIVHVVINLPEHSSWHRVMLHPGILKRLSAKQSKDLVASLADAINEKSRQRKLADAAKDSTSTESGNDAKPKSNAFVKVTTVKLLAQLMAHAEFIGESFTVEILTKLFLEATHVDIRAATVESLLAIVDLTKDASIEETVMSALETHVVPFAAELSERSPMTEQRWSECEETSKLPDIDDNPARDALTAFVTRSTYLKDPSRTRALIRRLLLPLYQKSAANGRRWLKIALRVSNKSEVYPHVPEAFSCYDLLLHLLKTHPSHMPAALFDDLHALLVFFASESKPYQDLEACFREMVIPPIKHAAYIRIAIPDALNAYDSDTANLLQTAIFATAQDATANNLLTPAQLQSHERTMIDIRLARFNQDPESWNILTSRHEPPLRKKDALQSAWYTYCRPLVGYMVERIGATRTSWLQNPQRQPARLPDAFPLRLWLLTYPSRPWRADNEQDLRRDKFVEELRDMIVQLAQSGRPYHRHFDLVVTAAKRCYEKDWAFIAWRLGYLEEEQAGRDLTLAELLRVELADILLQGAKQPVTEEVISGVKDMLAQWRRCLDEDVRDRGIATTALLRKNAKNKDALPME
jgi:hypothetical protein